MSRSRRIAGLALALAAVAAATFGAMYVSVACESLPGFLGGVAGDNHPRTVLGLVLLGLAGVLAIVALTLRWRSAR
jgi:hypothetical protein